MTFVAEHPSLEAVNENTPLVDDGNHREDGLLTTLSSLLADEEAAFTSSIPRPDQAQRSRSFSEVFEDAVELITEEVKVIQEEIVHVMETEIQPVKPRNPEGSIPLVHPVPGSPHTAKLSVLTLAILVFYKVSGGPFGCEPTIRAAGPFYGLLGFCLFPIFWCLPEALVTAELGSIYPEPSGSVAWIEEAFGPTAGLLCGYFHWVSGATDNAIYPSLFLEYLSSYLKMLHASEMAANDKVEASSTDILSETGWRWALCCLMTIVLAFINFSGLQVVGNLSIVIVILAMSPFVLLVVLGSQKVDPARWLVLPDNTTLTDDTAHSSDTFFPEFALGGILWRPFVNNLFWNMNSFDVGASFAAELENTERNFGRAMMISVAFVAFSYILPLAVAVGATDDSQHEWKAGHLTEAAGIVVGPWLAAWTVLAAAASNVALFLAELAGDAYQLMGMADRGLIPKAFAKRSRFNTPTNGILLGTGVILCLSVADFDALVEMLNFAYSVSLLMEFAAFIKLRMDDEAEGEVSEEVAPAADSVKPYRLPFGTLGCIIFVSPACAICVFVMITASKVTYIYVTALVLFGFCFHMMQKIAKLHGWLEYAVAPRTKKSKR